MEGDHIKTYEVLTPLSWIYGFGVWIRNLMFDTGLLRSHSFDVPIISIGNITVGGTGKTPHTEYLIKLLHRNNQISILSRGYKRKSRGFRLATSETQMSEIGDEPYQMKRKFPFIHMAVDKDRCHGIKQLIKPEVNPTTDVIILDDAYQHRYVSPGINILLMDYHRLIYYDKLMPAGRLREPQSSKNRADIVIITKCPLYITPMDQRGIERSLNLQPWQRLFFSTFRYGDLEQITNRQKTKPLGSLTKYSGKILLVSGIASPVQLEYDLEKMAKIESIRFSDHHNFTKRDLRQIENRYNALADGDGISPIIITTEKDATRLCNVFSSPNVGNLVSQSVIDNMYVLPIEVSFMNDKEEDFNQIITGYVQKNSRNSTLHTGKNAHKA